MFIIECLACGNKTMVDISNSEGLTTRNLSFKGLNGSECDDIIDIYPCGYDGEIAIECKKCGKKITEA